MKTFIGCLILIALHSNCSTSEREGNATESTSKTQEDLRVIEKQTVTDTLKGSLKAKAMGTIGTTNISISYYSPAVRGRVIWGGLVPVDNVWVTGAHRATRIDFNKEIEIGGVSLTPGKYALFTIPGKEEWTVIINKKWDQHLTDNYSQKDDVVRVLVKKEEEELNQERLQYIIQENTKKEGEINIYWEKVKVSIPIKVY
ncbi:MAG: DUF2911 domain-containing protein [Bacteroidia bacterium]|nr:DUF2911 domain-containing protein [Bacteroidia bacterium]